MGVPGTTEIIEVRPSKAGDFWDWPMNCVLEEFCYTDHPDSRWTPIRLGTNAPRKPSDCRSKYLQVKISHKWEPVPVTITSKEPMEGRKNDDGKLRYDLIPAKPLEEVVKVYTLGAKKYTDRNWENGLKWGRVFAAMMRHAWAWWRGEKNDPVDGQHHLASVAWCALALMEYEETHPELDDRKDPK